MLFFGLKAYRIRKFMSYKCNVDIQITASLFISLLDTLVSSQHLWSSCIASAFNYCCHRVYYYDFLIRRNGNLFDYFQLPVDVLTIKIVNAAVDRKKLLWLPTLLVFIVLSCQRSIRKWKKWAFESVIVENMRFLRSDKCAITFCVRKNAT